MMRSLAAVFALGLVAAGCAEAPPLRPAATVMRGAKPVVMKQLADALARGGHVCTIDADTDLLCDADRRMSPTIVVSYHTGPGGIHLGLVSGFPWKRKDPCADLAKSVNTFNGRARDFYAVCTPEGLTLITMLVVPETGLGDRDAQAFVNWWSRAAVEAAAGPPFGAEVQ